MLLALVSIISSYLVFTKYFNLKKFDSILIANLVTFSNALTISATSHFQLFWVWTIPSFILALMIYQRNPKLRYLTFIFLVVYFWITAFTAIYIFVFLFFFLILFFLQDLFFNNLRILRLYFNFINSSIFMIFTVIALFIFYVIYFKVYLIQSGWSLIDLQSFSVPLVNILNVGYGNFVWGNFLIDFFDFSYDLLYDHERSLTITPVLFLVYILMFISLKPQIPRFQLYIFNSLLILYLIPIKIFNFSIWYFLIQIPGLDAIRSINRIYIFIHVLLIFHFAFLYKYINLKSILARFLLLALLIEQINSAVNINLNVPEQLQLLRSGKNPPVNCSYFYAITGFDNKPVWAQQLDAMMVSAVSGVPTLNGYSGKRPVGWDAGWMAGPDYRDKMKEWSLNSGLALNDSCTFDLDNRIWIETGQEKS